MVNGGDYVHFGLLSFRLGFLCSSHGFNYDPVVIPHNFIHRYIFCFLKLFDDLHEVVEFLN